MKECDQIRKEKINGRRKNGMIERKRNRRKESRNFVEESFEKRCLHSYVANLNDIYRVSCVRIWVVGRVCE